MPPQDTYIRESEVEISRSLAAGPVIAYMAFEAPTKNDCIDMLFQKKK